jgi:hypothetical protein
MTRPLVSFRDREVSAMLNEGSAPRFVNGRSPMMYASELWEWLFTIDAPFAFLLTLPFLVAAAGLLGEAVRGLDRRRSGDHRAD